MPTLKTSFAPEIESRFVAEQAGRYLYVRRLGEGGIGEVNVMRDQSLERDIAFKELHSRLTVSSLTPGATPGSTGRTPAELRFVNEARITGQLEHPGIVPVYELGRRHDGRLYYTMRLVRGRTLTEACAGRNLRERLDLLPQFVALCQAVAYAHDRGVVHRDLKPDNVMLGAFGETIVLDWGLAKAKGEKDIQGPALADELERLRAEDGMKTVAGLPLGTPSYMPPEQARGDLDAIDERSDVYALGAILYQLLTGRPPFVEGSAWDVIRAVQSQPVQSPLALDAQCPPELAAIALRALAKRPEARYPDAQKLAADVGAFLTGGLVGAHRYGARALVLRFLRRHAAVLATATALVLVAAGAWWYRGVTHQRETARLEAERRARVTAEVSGLLAEVAQGRLGESWLDLYSYRLIALEEPLVEELLVPALGDPNPDVRRLAARALGGMKSKRAVAALVARLAPRVEPSPEVVIEVINALGIIGDAAAEMPVAEARYRAGQHSAVWKRTELGYKMLPLPALSDGGAALSAEAWKVRGRALQDKGRTDDAIEALSRAIALEPRLAAAYNNRGNVYYARRDLAHALADFDQALALDPNQDATLNNRALLKKQLDDYEGAVADFSRLVARGKLGPNSLRNRARARLALQDFDGALADFEAAAQAEPSNPLNDSGRAEVWLVKNDLERAREALDRALALDPKYTRALVRRALVHHALGDLVAARSDLERALALEPGEPWATFHLALLELDAGRGADALQLVERAVALAPDKSTPLGHRAIIAHLVGRPLADALVDLERASATEEDAVARVEYALYQVAILLGRGDRAGARRVVRGLPDGAEPRFYLALARLLGGRAPSARDLALAYSPERACSFELAAGLGAELNGERPRAQTHYQRARDLRRPNDAGCRLAGHALERLAR